MQSKSATNVKVIDVSHHQGSIDWAKVKASGVKGAFIKATEGKTGVDLKFSSNAAQAFAQGLKIGYYHYARPENNAPEDEAATFYRNVKGLPVDFPHVLDVEGESALLGAKLTDWCVRWLTAVEKLSGHPAMVYTGGSFAKSYLGAALSKWPLWIAHYGVDKPMDNPTWSSWSVFQYTSGGSVPGIAGNVDMNAMEMDFYNKYSDEPIAPPAAPIIPKVVKGDKLVVTGELLDGRMHAPLASVLDAAGVPYHWDNETKKLYLL